MITWTQARSELARAVRSGESPEVISGLRREYTAARLAHLIRSAAPELTAAHRAELSGVLSGGDPDAA